MPTLYGVVSRSQTPPLFGRYKKGEEFGYARLLYRQVYSSAMAVRNSNGRLDYHANFVFVQAATKLPSIEEVLEMELSELFTLCEDLQLDIEGIDDLVAEEQFQSAILEYIKKIATGRSTTSCLVCMNVFQS